MGSMLLALLLLQQTEPKESLRFEHVYEQERDTSCGFSTVGTLLSLYWNIPVTETELIDAVLDRGTSDYSVSLHALNLLLGGYGLETKGFSMTIDELLEVCPRFAPIIVHYRVPNKHYALLIGVITESTVRSSSHAELDPPADTPRRRAGTYLVLADPARGRSIVTVQRFIERWSGAVLLVGSRYHSVDRTRVAEVLDTAQRRITQLERLAWEIGY